jgi:hypothetical protein
MRLVASVGVRSKLLEILVGAQANVKRKWTGVAV